MSQPLGALMTEAITLKSSALQENTGDTGGGGGRREPRGRRTGFKHVCPAFNASQRSQVEEVLFMTPTVGKQTLHLLYANPEQGKKT